MTTKIKCAVKTHSEGITVGITPGDKILLFHSRDYDSRGNLSGDFLDVTDICKRIGKGDADDGFYMLYL